MKQLSISDYARELQELGCTGETAAEILKLLGQNQYEAAAALLKLHKQRLLDELHSAGQKVDLLDFLLYQIKTIPITINERMTRMKKKLLPLLGLSLLLCTGLGTAYADNTQNTSPANISASTERTDLKMAAKEQLNLTNEWDKTFAQSDKVNHSKVTFVNRYGITLAADMYVPQNAQGKLPAIAVCGPFGAVKEQASGLYAQTMAERGFLTIAFDPSYTGESGGQPRYMASPDINTEDFQAAIDFLSTNEMVDPDRIGIIGICGWGGMALNTAALDTRIKAASAITMYDMARVNANGYFDSENTDDARYAKRQALNKQRTADYKNGSYTLGGGVVDPLPADAPFFVKDYYDYYKTERGYHPRSLNSNGGWNVIGCMSFLNQPILAYTNEIRSAVLIIHGEKAHSCYFSRDAYKNMVEGNPYTDNKELLIIPDAVHTDLYDGGAKNHIPFDKLESFFNEYLK